ncbi:MAG: TolC family outer membrane protein [Tahibacter sp.]
MNTRTSRKLLPLALALLLGPTLASAEDLMQSYELARQSDPTVRVSAAQRESISEGVDQATAQLLPQIAASLSYTRDHSSGLSQQFFPDENGNLVEFPVTSSARGRGTSLQGNLTQSILDFSRWTARKAAKELARRGDAVYSAAENDLMIRTATTYFAVLTAEDTLTFSQAEEKALSRQLDQAQQRYEVGLSAITDVNEAKAQHDSATAAAISAQNALDDAREALREITGKEPGNLSRLRPDLPMLPPEPNNIEAWVNQAVSDNPTLKAQELALAAANTNINTARAGHLPTLSGSITYTKQPSWSDNTSSGYDGERHLNGERRDTAVGILLNVPIFTGGYTQSRVRQAVYDRDATSETYEQQKRAITRQARSNFRAVVAGISEVEARKQAVVSANSALEATQAGFEVGTRTIVDVLLSQRQLYQAQRDYSNARHNFVLNRLRLRQSAGNIAPKDLGEVNALLE